MLYYENRTQHDMALWWLALWWLAQIREAGDGGPGGGCGGVKGREVEMD